MVEMNEQLHSAEIYDQAVQRLRTRVWVWIVVVTGVGMVALRLVRYLNGVTTSPPLAMVMQIVLGIVLVGGFLLRNTRYVTYFQFGFLLAFGLFAPISFLFFGGIRGLGEINVILLLMGAFIFGFRRWTALCLAASAMALIYVSYLEFIDEPVPPLFDEHSVFFSFKFISMLTLLLLYLWIAAQFYQRLFDSYRRFSEAQIAINAKLQATTQQLEATSHQLKISRQNLVAAREEERRRLRRDLHDGLGPTIAAQVFRVGAARNLYVKQPVKAEDFLEQVEEGMGGTLITIKELVDELRPPLIAQLGLDGALNTLASNLEAPFLLELNVGEIPSNLGAATETAAWRIANIALDNVARHSSAATCKLTLNAPNGHLKLVIEDDGVGIPSNAAEGVGLQSMRERTAELRGSLTITQRKGGGTIITTLLPLTSGVDE